MVPISLGEMRVVKELARYSLPYLAGFDAVLRDEFGSKGSNEDVYRTF